MILINELYPTRDLSLRVRSSRDTLQSCSLYCHVSVTRSEVWIDNCIYCTLITLVTTSNYNALTYSHNPLLPTKDTKSSQFLFTSRCSVTVLTNVDSFIVFVLKGSCPRWMVTPSQLTASVVRLNCCRASPTHSFLAAGVVEFYDKDFFLS
jgi:hypothetical protein